jgi:hypothetical protein
MKGTSGVLSMARWWKGVGAVPMRTGHRWWWAVGCVLLLSGCATLDRTIGAAEKIAHAGADTISILRGPLEDANAVWEATLGGTDAPPAPAPDAK